MEKKWYGVSAVQQGNVVVGLWRTTGDKEEAVPVEDENGTQLKRTLTAVGSWKASFEGLPRYSESGAAYTYFARELTIGGKPAKDAGFFIYHEDTESKTVIANIGKRDISSTKTWRDDQNAYGTRPEELTLTLYRSISGGTEETLSLIHIYNAHRLPVTVAVYSRVDKYGYQSNQKITEVTLGNGVWYKIAGIGRLQMCIRDRHFSDRYSNDGAYLHRWSRYNQSKEKSDCAVPQRADWLCVSGI